MRAKYIWLGAIFILSQFQYSSYGLAVDYAYHPNFQSKRLPIDQSGDEVSEFEYEYVYDMVEASEDSDDFVDLSEENFEKPVASALRTGEDNEKRYILRKILRKRRLLTQSYYNKSR